MHGVCHVWEGCALALSAAFAYAWADVYPWLTGVTAVCGFILATHGVYRLAWRWWHGLPTLLNEHEHHDGSL